MRIKGTDRDAVAAFVAKSTPIGDYARLYPSTPERVVAIITDTASEYAEMGLALVIETAESAADRAGRLCARFGLTASEAALAIFLADGGTLTGFAEARRVSQNTVRNQLRQVFDKTGVRRQAELVHALRDF